MPGDRYGRSGRRPGPTPFRSPAAGTRLGRFPDYRPEVAVTSITACAASPLPTPRRAARTSSIPAATRRRGARRWHSGAEPLDTGSACGRHGGLLSGRGGWRVRLKRGGRRRRWCCCATPTSPPSRSHGRRATAFTPASSRPSAPTSHRRPPPFPWRIVQDRGSDLRENCPSIPAIPARILLGATEADDAAIEQILGGSVVFYGAYFHGAADSMNTPCTTTYPPCSCTPPRSTT